MAGRSVRATRAAWPWGCGALVVLALLALQTQLYSGQVRGVTAVFMFIALAQAWNIIGGFAGYASFGHVAFFGVGGYTAALLMTRTGLSFWWSLPVGGLAAAALAVLVGTPLLRLKGHYFAVATLGIAEGLREITVNLPGLTGGGAGLSIPVVGPAAATGYLGNDAFYLLFLALAGAATAIVGILTRSRLGYALRAIRENEDAAGASGVDTTRAKVTAFAVSALITGLVGAAYAFRLVAVYPDRLFDVEISMLMVIMVVIGGSGTVLGPVLGAVGLQVLSEALRVALPGGHTIVLGVVVVLVVVLVPRGPVFWVRDRVGRNRPAASESLWRYRL